MKASRKAEPKLTAAARGILRAKIRTHPNAAQHVKSGDQVSVMKKAELLSTARKLGIDIEEIVKQAQAAPSTTGFEIELAAERAEGYAFSGIIEFDIQMSLLGATFERRGRIIYEHTPDWAYLSQKTGTERLGSDSSSFELEVLAILEREVWEGVNGKVVKRKNKPYWTSVEGLMQDGVLPESLMDMIFDKIDHDARRQDVANRARAHT
jgi:hypothetical protein